jgi:formylglycine-generating enzyme required for sulfatase activity
MALVANLVCFGLRQALGDGIDRVLDTVGERFRDHSRALPRALARANDRAWQAFAVALAGDGTFEYLKVYFSNADARALREQVCPFLLHSAAYLDQTPATFRKACLAELHAARQEGLLSAEGITVAIAGQGTAAVPFAGQPQALIDGAHRAVKQLADDLAPRCPALAQLLRQPVPSGPPLLVAAFAFFFRREVETDEQLARSLTFDGLQHLSAAQAAAFTDMSKALSELGDRFDELLGHLAKIEGTVVATHGAVLDLRAELERLGRTQANALGEVRRLIECALSPAKSISPPPVEALPEPLTRALQKRIKQAVAQRPHSVDDVLRVLGLLDQGARPAARANALGMTFVWVLPGSFLMGSPPEEPGRGDDETQHAVALPHGLHLAAHPVTQEQWRAVMGNSPSRFPGDDHPVEMVSWDDCQAFCRTLSDRDGRPYRLPTEAEWEQACRAGSAAAFAFGAELTAGQANHAGQATTAVGASAPNGWGLYDMHGNVYEWCADWYGPYEGTHASAPSGPAEGDGRVLRGGSWFSPARCCRCAARYWADPATRSAHIGLRVCYS